MTMNLPLRLPPSPWGSDTGKVWVPERALASGRGRAGYLPSSGVPLWCRERCTAGQRAWVPVGTRWQREVQVTLVSVFCVCACVKKQGLKGWGAALCIACWAETGLVLCLLCLISPQKEVQGPCNGKVGQLISFQAHLLACAYARHCRSYR